MIDKKFNEGLLVAFADGQLGSDEIAVVEAALNADPTLQARVDKFKKTGELLKSSIDIENEVTPSHITHRIREIERVAIKKRKKESERGASSLQISWRFLSSLGGSFAAGLACAVFIISPSLMKPVEDASQFQPSAHNQQITMRGSEQFERPYLQQKGVNILDGGNIQAVVPFTLVYKSPISGKFGIWEIVPTSESPNSESIIAWSQDATELDGGKADEGVYIESSLFKIEDQKTLRFRIRVSNDVTSIVHEIEFTVLQ
jgi:hypothetical protein